MPGMDPIYVIGDIHGQADMLDEALSFIHDDADSGAPVVFVGDYIDRGPDSRAVLDTLIEGQAEGEPWVCLMGNHDRYLLRFLDNPDYRDPRTSRNLHYLDDPIGGRATLASYGVDADPRRKLADIHADAVQAVPPAHRAFLAGLPLTHQTGAQFFAHAGIRPGVPLDQQTEDDLLWIRAEFLNDPRDHGPLIVHGHTPQACPVHHGNRLNLDGGAGYGRPLCPAVL